MYIYTDSNLLATCNRAAEWNIFVAYRSASIWKTISCLSQNN